MKGSQQHEGVLAIAISSNRFAYVAFKGPLSPVGWDTRSIDPKARNAAVVDDIAELIGRYEPDVVVLPDIGSCHRRRAPRTRRLPYLIQNYARGQAIDVYSYSRQQVRACFEPAGALARHEIAHAIAARVHELGLLAPKIRKLWQREPRSLCLFDAAALAMTHYATAEPRRE